MGPLLDGLDCVIRLLVAGFGLLVGKEEFCLLTSSSSSAKAEEEAVFIQNLKNSPGIELLTRTDYGRKNIYIMCSQIETQGGEVYGFRAVTLLLHMTTSRNFLDWELTSHSDDEPTLGESCGLGAGVM